MNANAKALLAQLLAALEPVGEAAATAAGGPAAGAAVAVAANLGEAALASPGVVVTTPGPTGATAVAGVTNGGNVSAADFQALQQQMAQMVSLMTAQQNSLTAVHGAVQDLRSETPGPGVQPVVTDPTAHPILVAAGRAKLVAGDPLPTDADLPTDGSATLPAVVLAVNALHSKLAALVEATGMGGSAAMASHA